ncbi:MAG: hypothetical protein WKF50_08330 [Nocardioides sp.]
MTARRPVPGARGKCRRCGDNVVWARTLASPTGRGGKSMPLNPLEDTEGNVAIRPTSNYQAVARVLGKGETHDLTTEVLAMTHFATCQPKIEGTTPAGLPDGVVDFAAHRAKKRSPR